MSLILAVLLCIQETPEKLVERLRTDSVEERDRAIKTLIDWGEKARPALEKAALHPDKEVAERAKRILAAIDRQQAEKEYARIEETLLAAKSLRFQFRLERMKEGWDKPVEDRGTVFFDGKSVLLDVNPQAQGTQARGLLVADGQWMYWRAFKGAPHRSATYDNALPDLGNRMRRCFLSDGAGASPWLIQASDRAELERLLLADTVPLARTREDGKLRTLSTEVVTDRSEIRSTCWYEPRTCELIRRVTRWKEDGKETVLTETYSEWSFNPAFHKDTFDATACRAGFKATMLRLIDPEDFKDGTPIRQDSAYVTVLERLLRIAPERIAGEFSTVDYATLTGKSPEMRAQPVRLRLLFLQSNPVPLAEKPGGIEKVHRTYLCNPAGTEGYVVDLLEAPPALEKKTTVSLDAIFLRLGTYEGQKGMVQVPFLVGQRLTVAPEK